MITKEAMEKVVDIIYPYIGGFAKWDVGEITAYGQAEKVAKQTLEAIDYHKLPKDKPPLLTNEEIEKYHFSRYITADLGGLVRAQRESDIKFYTGGRDGIHK